MRPMYPNTRTRPLGAIIVSLLLAFFVLIYPLASSQEWQRPLLLVVAVLFWSLYQPRYVGVGVAFILGLMADIVTQGRLGQHSILLVCLVLWVNVCRHYWYPLIGWRVWLVALLGMALASSVHDLWIAPAVLTQSAVKIPLTQIIAIHTGVSIGLWVLMMGLYRRHRQPLTDDD